MFSVVIKSGHLNMKLHVLSLKKVNNRGQAGELASPDKVTVNVYPEESRLLKKEVTVLHKYLIQMKLHCPENGCYKRLVGL